MRVDYTRDELLSEISKVTLKEKYLLPSENSPQDGFVRAAKAFSDDDAHAQRIYDYASKLWFMFASPILSNGGTQRGFGISCFLNYTGDSRAELADHYAENVWLASGGGGIGGCWDDVRSAGTTTSKGNESTGIIPFMHVVDSYMLAFSQGKSRRGKYSFNLSVSHPEIEEFIDITNKHGGDIHRRAVHSYNCVTITNDFMKAVQSNAPWDLIDPHTKLVRKTVQASDLWFKILNARVQNGIPYIHYIDHSNDTLPQAQKNLNLKIRQTNLCTEITLPTGPDRTAVCCLSSVNLEKYDEWKDDPLFIEDLVRYLDNVLTVFISDATPQLHKAAYSAVRERSIGLGAMGWHSYLQSKLIPFESSLAISFTRNIFKNIKDKAEAATVKLALERGSAPDAIQGSKGKLVRRNMQRPAIAPNATSSIICGNTSPSIEPLYANYYIQSTQNGEFVAKNKYLEQCLQQVGQDTKEVWDSIRNNGGSVQHLEFLSDSIKAVFKTAFEIEQLWIIEQAAHRQEFICQSQSLNLFILPTETREYVHAIHMYAWLKKLKTLYYVRSKAPRKADILSQGVDRKIRDEYKGSELTVGEVGYPDESEGDECLACSG